MEKETKQAVVNTVFGSVFGNVEQKYMKEEAPSVSFDSPIALVQKRGNKIDLIRIANAMYEIGMAGAGDCVPAGTTRRTQL